MFITLEGGEGAGKTTLLNRLAAQLESQGRPTLTTREPGSGSIGPTIRRLILESATMVPAAELFLFLADRANHVAEVIMPSLLAGRVVLCDRFADSTVVYQGAARGYELDMLIELNQIATGGLSPNLTFVLDLDPQIAAKRTLKQDRLDQEPLEFHEKVREGFL